MVEVEDTGYDPYADEIRLPAGKAKGDTAIPGKLPVMRRIDRLPPAFSKHVRKQPSGGKTNTSSDADANDADVDDSHIVYEDEHGEFHHDPEQHHIETTLYSMMEVIDHSHGHFREELQVHFRDFIERQYADIVQLRRENADLVEENELLRTKNDKLDEEISKLNEENGELNRKTQSLQAKVTSLEKRLDESKNGQNEDDVQVGFEED